MKNEINRALVAKKKLFFVLMAVAAIAMTGTFIGCEKTPINDPDAPENGRERADYTSKWDSLGANQGNKAPMRMYLTVTSTETDGE